MPDGFAFAGDNAVVGSYTKPNLLCWLEAPGHQAQRITAFGDGAFAVAGKNHGRAEVEATIYSPEQ